MPDTHRDPIFADNPLVTNDPYVRFYAGVSLVTADGYALGTLCVLDRLPRELSAMQFAALACAAAVVMTLIEQRIAVEALEQARKRSDLLRSVAEMATDAIIIFERDAAGVVRIAYANRAYVTVTGMTSESIVGHDIDEIRPRTDDAGAARRWIHASIAAGVPATTELPILRADGTIGAFEVCIGPGEPPDADGRQHWLMVMRDIAALRRRDEARFAATHDVVTGIANETGLLHELDRRIASKEAFALACIDIERLDDAESSLGNGAAGAAAGALANGIARRLLATVDGGHALARIGATEYAVVLGSDDPAGTAVIDEYLRELSAPYRIGEIEAIVTASVGIAYVHVQSDANGETVVREARAHLATAKIADRSRHPSPHHAPARNGSHIDLRTLRAALEAAEFRLDYQPIVELGDTSDTLVGFEALLRWPQGAERGWSPLDAIVAAERTGFIHDLGAWIFNAACAQLVVWQRELRDAWGVCRLSVNISPTQIERAGFTAGILATLARHGCDPRGLTLELTETASMRDPLALRDVLVELREAEITIDLDDFGTGYSSLSRLHTFAIDRLKIDREFVSGAGDGIANDRIVETIVSLGERMGMGVLAEGVETAQQRSALRDLGCAYAQGYLFARALPAADATALVVTKNGIGVRRSRLA